MNKDKNKGHTDTKEHDTEKEPGIIFEKFGIVKIDFDDNATDEKIEIEYNFTGSHRIENDKLIVRLTCDIFKNIKLFIESIGTFRVDEKSPNMDLEKFAKNNAIAIMFPFLRQVIYSITGNSFLPPLLMPPMNVAKLIKEADKKG